VTSETKLPPIPAVLLDVLVKARNRPTHHLKVIGLVKSYARAAVKLNIEAAMDAVRMYGGSYTNAEILEMPCARAVAEQAVISETKLPEFPTMLRKMWSGGEVQRWIDENIAPLWNARAWVETKVEDTRSERVKQWFRCDHAEPRTLQEAVEERNFLLDSYVAIAIALGFTEYADESDILARAAVEQSKPEGDAGAWRLDERGLLVHVGANAP
jgi:hypothetical protein